MFSEREASSFGTSDFVVTRGYVQIRVVGFPSSVVAGGAGRCGAVRGPCLKRRGAVARGSLGVENAPSERALAPAAAARAAICRLRKYC